MSEEIEAIISKGDWERIKSGYLLGANGRGTLDFCSEGLLHHIFGGEPEKEVVRVKISKVE